MKNRTKTRRSRRFFLKTCSSAGLAAAFAVPEVLSASALGRGENVAPSEKITLGGVGLFNRGTHDLKTFLAHSDVQVLAVCDVQQRRRTACKELVDARNHDTACAVYRDMRELFDRSDIDAVLIAAGNRWHTLASIWAARAGKDIYCEKPVSMTIREAHRLEEIISQHDVVFQAGTQRRNNDNYQFAVNLAQSGKLGKLLEVHADILWPGTSPNWYPAEPAPDPEICDWDLWLGPVQWRPFNHRYVESAGWYRIDDFEGEMPGWASHTLDMCQWAAQKDDTVPVEWYPQFNEKGEQKWDIHARYADGLRLIMRPNDWLGLGSCAIRLVGEEGWVETGDTARVAVSDDRLRQGMKVFRDGISEEKHISEFLKCVRTRQNPTSNVHVTVNSHIACHCASMAWKLGRNLKFDPETELFDDSAANGLKNRAAREPFTL